MEVARNSCGTLSSNEESREESRSRPDWSIRLAWLELRESALLTRPWLLKVSGSIQSDIVAEYLYSETNIEFSFGEKYDTLLLRHIMLLFCN